MNHSTYLSVNGIECLEQYNFNATENDSKWFEIRNFIIRSRKGNVVPYKFHGKQTFYLHGNLISKIDSSHHSPDVNIAFKTYSLDYGNGCDNSERGYWIVDNSFNYFKLSLKNAHAEYMKISMECELMLMFYFNCYECIIRSESTSNCSLKENFECASTIDEICQESLNSQFPFPYDYVVKYNDFFFANLCERNLKSSCKLMKSIKVNIYQCYLI